MSHNGLHYFTLGKRIGKTSPSTTNYEGLYVSGFDFETETIYIVTFLF